MTTLLTIAVVAATAGLLLGSLFSLPAFAQVPHGGIWIMEGGTQDGKKHEVYIRNEGKGKWSAQFTGSPHQCSFGDHSMFTTILTAKGKIIRCPSRDYVKKCTNLSHEAYPVDFTATVAGDTIKGTYKTEGAVENKRRSDSKEKPTCTPDPRQDVTLHFTLRRKTPCPTKAQQDVARKILEAVYPNLVVPQGDLTPEVVKFAFELFQRVNDGSRLSKALSEGLGIITSLPEVAEAVVKGLADYLADPGAFKTNPAALAQVKRYERTLRTHFNSVPTGGPCGERSHQFPGF